MWNNKMKLPTSNRPVPRKKHQRIGDDTTTGGGKAMPNDGHTDRASANRELQLHHEEFYS